jgi:predicted Zn-ribbon and HTH transcriptional regulator
MEKKNLIEEIMCECQKCGYRWIPRILEKPKSCPRCKNRNWEKLLKNNK